MTKHWNRVIMEKISIFIVLLVSLDGFDAQDCNFDYYYKSGKGCVQCPPCRPGNEITMNCGHNKTGHKTRNECSPCSSGLTYNDKETSTGCKPCQDCQETKQIQIKACTVTSNTVCRCPKGTYERKDGGCQKCSYCCGVSWEQNNNIVPACKEQGLGRCICKPSFFCSGKCASPTTAPITTLQTTTTTATTTTTTTPRSEELKHNATQIPSASDVIFKPEPELNRGKLDPNAKQEAKPVYPYLKPGWIVLICLGAVSVVGSLTVLWFHKRTRKQISGFCCRKYGMLSPDVDTTSALVEGHYAEPGERNTGNNATPIPPGEEPVPPIFYSSSTSDEVYCRCRIRETEDAQMQCACTMDTSETSIDKLVHSSSSAETISEELQRYSKDKEQDRQTSSWRNSPNTSSSSRLSSPRTSDHNCVTSSSTSNCVTLSPPSGRPPDHYRVTSSSNSICVSPSPPRGRSPEHRCVTPSACVTPTSSRGRSPDPSSLSSVQSHSSFSEDQEICNQSNEYTQSSESQRIPISIEAYEKEHDRDATKALMKDTLSAPGKIKEGRKSPSPKKGVACARARGLTEDTDKDVTPITTSDRGPGSVATATNANDIKLNEIGPLKNQASVAANQPGRCIYRRIHRDEDAEHRCLECCPQPGDSFFQLINRERLCLKEDICKELNRSYKELAFFGRVDSRMTEYETSLNPAERVLDRIKALEPGLKLKEFEEMLRQLKRLDIVQLIQTHHKSCTFCQRNRFDSKA